MNIQYNYLFPTMIMEVDDLLNEEECQHILEYWEKTKNKKTIVSDNILNVCLGEFETSYGVVSDIINEIENDTEIKNLRKRIQQCVNIYNEKFSVREMRISNSWINLQKENSYGTFHFHADSIISGAFFINVDNYSSSLSFENPNDFHLYMQKMKITDTNYDTYTFNPKNGTLILFPSYIRHGHMKINKTNNRCILSFNTEYER